MNTTTVSGRPQQNAGLPGEETKTVPAQTPAAGCSMDSRGPAAPDWAELIRLYRDGDTKAALALSSAFRPLLEKEAESLLRLRLVPSPEDAKSQAILHFFEVLDTFRGKDVESRKIPGLVKKYLHDLRINLLHDARRHCPECCPVDFEKELAENTPFSQCFPCYEMETDDQLESRFRTLKLLESMEILPRKEKTVIRSFFAENKSPSQIAGELHCSTRYLRRLKQGALKRMRRYLKSNYPDLTAR